jgi:hypothetical protein
MPDLNAALRQRILQALDAARADVQGLAAGGAIPNGYLGFQLVEQRILQCRGAVENLTDRDAVLKMLQRLDGAVKLTGGGAVAPAVKRLREKLAELEDALQAL